MFGAIKTVAVYVADPQAAKRFYVEHLAFEVRRELPMGPDACWLEVAPPGAETCLVIYPRTATPDWAQRKTSIVFYCADITSTIETLRSRGVTIAMEPNALPWGKFAAIEDPDGNVIGLTEQTISLQPQQGVD